MKMFKIGGLNPVFRRLMAGILLAGLLLGITSAKAAVGGTGLSSNVMAQIQALEQEKSTFTATEQKMDSQLVLAFRAGNGEVIANGAVPQMIIGVSADTNGMVMVDIQGNVTSNLLAQIAQFGGQITNSFPAFGAIRANIPLNQVEAIAALSDLRFIRPAVKALPNSDPEGVVVHRDGQGRTNFMVNGSNVKVGVISDSVDYLTDAQATGDCGPVVVLPGQSGIPGSGEGTAMLEIVYAMAPGANLYFATGFGGEASFAQNILNLRAAGCDIIVDDIGYFDESPFQDGVVAQAVNKVTADGALYFSAAGNEGNLDSGYSGTWQGDFSNGGAVGSPVNSKGGFVHSFGGVNYDTVTRDGEFENLFWSDPAGGSTNDYDLFLLDSSGATIVGSSITVQNGTQDPYEIIYNSPSAGQQIVIVLASGTNRFLYTENFRGTLSIGTSGNITGHATATNAFATAAIDVHTAYPNPFSGGSVNPVEYFSSDGPRRVFYFADGTPITPGNFSSTGGFVRQKPDIAAANGVTTTLPSDSGLNPFYGTSAAAPHAAAIAALLKSYNSTLTPAQVRSIMTESALDIMAKGVDQDSGSGIVMALQALQGTPLPSPAPNLAYLTNYISGGNGNGIIDVDECDSMYLALTNSGATNATGITATLSTLTPGVLVAQPTAVYPNAAVGAVVTNLNPFQISISPTFLCGSSIAFSLAFKYDQGSATINFTVPTGAAGAPVRFNNATPVLITTGATGVNSTVNVTNFNTALMHVQVSADVVESFDFDLTLQLISPDGTIVTLVQNDGGTGQNFGTDCSDQDRTLFDDNGTSLANSSAPFIGTFQPVAPLANFIGKSGTNVNGAWQLHAVDSVNGDLAQIQCWSLLLTPSLCVDGGGQCPGVDLAVGMIATPTSVIVGNNLTYNITVTNFGPDTANSVALSQTLPTNVTIVSVNTSQGGSSESPGVISCSLGTLLPGAVATATVVVTPTVTGTIFSTATVGSEQQDLNPANNSITIASLVTSPSSDLSVTLTANPNPVLLNGVLTYVATVINSGPSIASNVVMTNTLPLNVSYISATSSLGTVVPPQANILVANIGTLNVGSNAIVTVQVRPLVQGSILDSVYVSSSEPDPVSVNNIASITTTVSPAADLTVAINAPFSVVVGSNFVYQLNVTNFGPSAASGISVNDTLPSGIKFVSAVVSQGAYTSGTGTVSWQITNLAVGSNATFSINVGTSNLLTSVPITVQDTAVITATQADPNPTNNHAAFSTLVAYPKISVVASGFNLAAESFVPTNGMIDSGETVTVLLNLQNQGNVATAGNVYATLLSSNGVVPVGNPTQNYGILSPSAPVTSEPFVCKVTATNGGTAIATLQLVTNTTNLSTVSFTFNVPALNSYTNTNNIIIPDHGPATPYPSSNLVSGITGLVGKVTVTLTNVNHTYPDDIDMLLVGPLGQTTLLMSHAGFNGVLTNVSLAFDDLATNYLPPSSQIVSGTYKPSPYGTVSFASNAPAQPYGTNLAVFNGTSPNGYWRLFVFDSSPGDQGIIIGGWSLGINSGNEVNPVVDLAVTGAAFPSTTQIGNNLTYTFMVTNSGPNASTTSTFIDALPASLTFVSATNSAHTPVSVSNGVVSCSFTNLAAGSTTTVTLVVMPNAGGLITNSASIMGADSDPNQSNNSTSVATTVTSPTADLGVTITGNTNASQFSTANYSITVTNRGPQTGIGLILTNFFPNPSVLFDSFPMPGGNLMTSNGTTTYFLLGNLPAGASTNVQISLVVVTPGIYTNLVTITGASIDTNASNNMASFVTTVTAPAPQIIAAGIPKLYPALPYNSITPGAIVTMALGLQNIGNAPTSNLVATLMNTNGVTASSGATSYGVLSVGSQPTFGSFTFTATGSNGAALIPTLQLQDGTNNLGIVSFTFNLPASNSFVSSTLITIPDHGLATPYPSTISVANVSGVVTKATVTVSNLTHGFANDVEMLLMAPSGQGLVLMSGVGGANPITNAVLTFDDAASASLPATSAGTPVVSGTFLPSSFGLSLPFSSPAPAAPYFTRLASFDGSNPNGTWALFVLDNSPGDSGTIQGWSLNLSTVSPVNGAADLGLSLALPSVTYASVPFTVTLTITNKGPTNATDVYLSSPSLGGLTLISTSLGANRTNSGLLLYPGAILAGTSTNFSITLMAPGASQFTSSMSIAADQSDLNPADNTVQLSVSVHALPKLTAVTGPGSGKTNLILTLAGDAGVYNIQAATSLSTGSNTWVQVGTITNVLGTIQYTATNVLAYPARYYRAVLAPQ